MACDCTDCDECMEAAGLKARRLLHSLLNRYQRSLLKRRDFITVRGGVTGDKYAIFNNEDAWVSRLRDGRGYCLEVIDEGDRDSTPVPDQMLAKKILLEAAEKLFLKTACASGGDE
jgi:hypothetical protein